MKQNRKVQTEDIIYKEEIFPKVEMGALGVIIIAVVFLIFITYPFLILSLLLPLAILIVFMYMFRKFIIKMTSDSIIVKYGFSKCTIPWENIEGCYLDKTSAFWYGGWGLRMGRVNGKWRDIYNIIGFPRVVLSLKKDKFFKELVFSTKNPDQVMEVINKKINKV